MKKIILAVCLLLHSIGKAETITDSKKIHHFLNHYSSITTDIMSYAAVYGFSKVIKLEVTRWTEAVPEPEDQTYDCHIEVKIAFESGMSHSASTVEPGKCRLK